MSKKKLTQDEVFLKLEKELSFPKKFYQLRFGAELSKTLDDGFPLVYSKLADIDEIKNKCELSSFMGYNENMSLEVSFLFDELDKYQNHIIKGLRIYKTLKKRKDYQKTKDFFEHKIPIRTEEDIKFHLKTVDNVVISLVLLQSIINAGNMIITCKKFIEEENYKDAMIYILHIVRFITYMQESDTIRYIRKGIEFTRTPNKLRAEAKNKAIEQKKELLDKGYSPTKANGILQERFENIPEYEELFKDYGTDNWKKFFQIEKNGKTR
jgi:hypothetical protein